MLFGKNAYFQLRIHWNNMKNTQPRTNIIRFIEQIHLDMQMDYR